LFARTAGFKEPSVYDLNVPHRIQLFADVVKLTSRKVNQVGRVRPIDRKGGAEYLEPKQVDYLHIISCPFVIVHFRQLFISYQLANYLLLKRIFVIIWNWSCFNENVVVKLRKHFVIEPMVW